MRLHVMQSATYGLNDICAEHYNPLLMIVCMIFISPFAFGVVWPVSQLRSADV